MRKSTLTTLTGLIAICMAASAAFAGDALPKSFLLDRLPADAQEIGEAMQSAKQGERIVLRGRIADGRDVFAPNRAIFVLADEAAIPPCCASEIGKTEPSSESCSVPASKRASIRFLDDGDRLLTVGLRNAHGMTIGKEVFVVGKVHEANNENLLIVDATGLHVPAGDVPFGLMLDDEPENVKNVAEAKEGAKAGDTVTIRGRVGGTMRPFVDGRAVFTIVGDGPLACSDIPGDNCRTPWDYCCVPRQEILRHSATIQVLDESGTLVRTDIKGRRGIKELSELVVVGKVVSAERGALIVSATGIYPAAP